MTKIRDQYEAKIREKLRAMGRKEKTIKAYVNWWVRFRRFVKLNYKQTPKAEEAVTGFLTEIAVKGNVAASTQNNAMQALCTVYEHVFNRPLVGINALRAKPRKTVREIVDPQTVIKILSNMSGVTLKAGLLMYGCGLRIGEVVSLRIKDLNFDRENILVRDGKHHRDRLVPFPREIHEWIRTQVESSRCLWRKDQEENANGVSLPYAWSRKSPRSHRDFAWYYLFCSDNYSRCPITDRLLRHHRNQDHIGSEVSLAVQKTGLPIRFTAHSFRHCFATHFVENGKGSGVLMDLMQILGHESIETTQTYLHASKYGPSSADSPLSRLLAQASLAAAKPQLRKLG
jgi:integrase